MSTKILYILTILALWGVTKSAIIQNPNPGYSDNYYQALYRNFIIEKNLENIRLANQQNPGFTLRANKYITYSAEEFQSLLLNTRVPSSIEQIQVVTSVENANYNFSVQNGQNGQISQSNIYLQNNYPFVSATLLDIDWNRQGKVTSVKNQGGCGSCWAFTAIADLESSFLLNGYQSPNGQQIDLSEQQLIDCAGSNYYNYGCRGGWMTNAFAYIYHNPVQSEQNYQYISREGVCRQNENPGSATFSLRNLRSYWNNQNCDLIVQILKSRPVTVAVVADSFYWGFYQSGILNRCPGNINHAVVVTGVRETTTGENYWIAKNSWGTDWGENGYVRIDRSQNGGNLCQICTYPQHSII